MQIGFLVKYEYAFAFDLSSVSYVEFGKKCIFKHITGNALI